MSAAEPLGAVLAGGESRRFGRDKAAEVVAGTSLVERAAETLAEVFEHVEIVSSREPASSRWPHGPDRREGQGPLAGIESALLRARELGLGGVFVLACDLPLVDAAVVRSVLAAGGPSLGGEAAACAASDAAHPRIQPLCALYRLSCLPTVSKALDSGRRAVRDVFTAVGGIAVTVPADVLLNVNRTEDAERARELLEPDRVRST